MKARPYTPIASDGITPRYVPPEGGPQVQVHAGSRADRPAGYEKPTPDPEPTPMPKLGEVEIFMNEDIEHAVRLYRSHDSGDDAGQLAGIRSVMMFALQVAAVNLGVHPDAMITERSFIVRPTPLSKRALRRKKGYPKS